MQKNGNYISVDWDGDRVADETVNLSGVNVYTCAESERNGLEVKTGSVDDILDFKTAGTDCSKIVIQTYYMNLRGVYVYN